MFLCSCHRSSCRAVRCSTFTSRPTTRSSERVSRPSTCRWTRPRWRRRAPSCRRPPRPTAPGTSTRGPRAEENRLRRQRRNSHIIIVITNISATASNIYERKRQDSSRDNPSPTETWRQVGSVGSRNRDHERLKSLWPSTPYSVRD